MVVLFGFSRVLVWLVSVFSLLVVLDILLLVWFMLVMVCLVLCVNGVVCWLSWVVRWCVWLVVVVKFFMFCLSLGVVMRLCVVLVIWFRLLRILCMFMFLSWFFSVWKVVVLVGILVVLLWLLLCSMFGGLL